MSQADEIVIKDFSSFLPGTVATPVEALPERGKWRCLKWESETETGISLFAYTEKTPDVAIPLDLEGYFAISLGLYSPALMPGTGIFAKLSEEDDYAFLKTVRAFNWFPLREGSYRFEEHFWKFADLTGKELHLRSSAKGSGLGFVRLIPLSEEQVEKLRSPKRIPWMTTNDGHGCFIPYSNFTQEMLPVDTFEDEPARMVTDNIEMFADSDVTTVSWCSMGADVVNYPTVKGRFFSNASSPVIRDYDTQISTNVERLAKAGYHAPTLAVETCRRNGLKILLAQRPQNFILEPPFDVVSTRFYREHMDDLTCRTREGRKTVQLSFAYPEVRRHLIEMLLEMADCKPDGLHLIFNRGIPCSLYEQPVLDTFRDEYGLDMKTLEPEDERVMAFRFRYITGFLGELREALDPKQEIAVSCFADRELNGRYGLDIEKWAETGLVGILFPFLWEWEQNEYDMEMFAAIEETTACRVWPLGYNGNLHRSCLPHEHRQRVLALIRAGAKGLYGWDMPRTIAELNLGRRNELEIWEEIARPLPQTDLLSFNGFSVESVASPHYTA